MISFFAKQGEIGMGCQPIGGGKERAGAGGGPAPRPARIAVDVILLFSFAVFAQVPAAYGVSAAEEAGLLFHPDALLPEGESFRLDAGVGGKADRFGYLYFSQVGAAIPGSISGFRLPSNVPTAGRAGAARQHPIQPIPSHHATTLQFGGPFPAARSRAVAAFLDVSDADAVARKLDYAQLLIARMMLPEARGVVAAVLANPEVLDATDGDRAAGYAAIIARLGEGTTDDLPAAWADDPLWPAIVANLPLHRPQLRAAVAALSGQSREVATTVLPMIFDLALASGDTTVAAEILVAAPSGTDLDGTALLDLMRGRLALAQGAEDMAFDTFARVAEGQDRAASEARIALADMALSRNDSALWPQVSRLLQDGLPRWRGDTTALRLRVRLARVAEDMGDLATAVEVMSMILHEHPATPEAELAAARSGVMVGRLADGIAIGATPLGEAIETVRRLDPALSPRGDWVRARVALAGRLADAGLTEAARAEYAAVAKLPAGTLAVADRGLTDTATVARARLLLDAGHETEALAVLDRYSYPRHADRSGAFVALRLQAGRTAILPDLLLAALKAADAKDIDDPAVQLALADVAFVTGQADAALSAYDKAIGHADRTQRLRAGMTAGQAGDVARAARYAAGLSGDRADLQRAAIASLAEPRLSGQRLSISGAAALITAARTAGASVDALLSAGAAP